MKIHLLAHVLSVHKRKKPAPEWYARIDQVRMGDGVIKGPACLPSAVQAELHLC